MNYRDRALHRLKLIAGPQMTATYEDYDEEEGEITVTIAVRYKICETCEGRGSHVNPGIDEHGLSRDDFDEQGPEFEEDYFSGVYDVRCYDCDGERAVAIPDERIEPPHKVARYWQAVHDTYHMYDEEDAERRVGA